MGFNKSKPLWGGNWTEKKLDAFSKYVTAYLTIMKKHPYWKTIYFDGFAGSGRRAEEASEQLIQLHILPEEEAVYQGAAERVLNLSEGLAFSFYYFIDTDEAALKDLETRLKTIPTSQGKKLEFRGGDANTRILELSRALKNNPSYAALVFLDPFGMQIDWDSIASLSGTRSDLWILVPSGVIINRLLDTKGELKFSAKLQSFFGLPLEDIKKEFFVTEQVETLFGEEERVQKILKPIEKIATLYVQRLGTLFPYVTQVPLRLENSKGVPIFHFVFAAKNQTGLKIAKDIIKTSK